MIEINHKSSLLWVDEEFQSDTLCISLQNPPEQHIYSIELSEEEVAKLILTLAKAGRRYRADKVFAAGMADPHTGQTIPPHNTP